MKTKELIKQLQENDPSGENEVCVGNADIHFVESYPAYYDGNLQVLIRDENLKGYNITGVKYIGEGIKINIHTLSASDVVFDNPNAEVIYDVSEQSEIWLRNRIENWRQEANKVESDLERWHFVDYLKKRFVNESEEFTNDEIEKLAFEFFDANMTLIEPIPADIVKKQLSYVDCRALQWDREITMDFEDGKPVLKKFTKPETMVE